MDYVPLGPGRPYGNQELRQRFLADQQLYAALGYLPQTNQGVTQQRGNFNQTGPTGAILQQDAPVYDGVGGNNYVGWGGQAIQDSTSFRVPWFGRSRTKVPRQRTKDELKSRAQRDLGAGQSGPTTAAFGRTPEDAMSVEDIVSAVQKLNKRDPLPEKVFRALYHLDSRAVALLLKDLSRVGLDKRAVELFDWLRWLGDRHMLRSLCDVYTYTAMISLCIYQQNIQRALELVDDMRIRNIERNVHTYTAFMNVCIKCGKLALALETYQSMKSVSCVPNAVTYNTLIDVYGKLGQWEKAVQVIDVMKNEGVEPVLRTYNTLIIACNMCNQPREALSVYHRMLTDGFTPNSTTFNALISAYGKTGQLEKALEIYNEMIRQNMDRSVITYSSIISACEKAGQWETALKIFSEMQQNGCAPNTVTYNSLITACAQGGRWEKANDVFEQMAAHGCTPDVVTYTALISAFERGGQWQLALQAFHKMCVQGCKPDAIVYNAIIDTLWETGVIWAQTKALELFYSAVQQGQFRQEPLHPNANRLELNLHAMTAGVAMLSLYCWLQEVKRLVEDEGETGLPRVMAIVTDAGKASKEQGNCIVKEAVAAMMNFWEAPFRPVQHCTYSAVLEATAEQVAGWVVSEAFAAQIASLFPMADPHKGFDPYSAPDESSIAKEEQVLQECHEAFGAVQHFEGTHGLVLQNMSAAYVQQRPALISRMLDFSSRLALKDEVVHDAVLLLDRTASTATPFGEDVLPLIAVAALVIGAKQGNADRLVETSDFEHVTEYPAPSIAKMEWNIGGLLNDDTSAISTMQCLKIYLERLGYRFLDKQDVYGMAGFSIMLAVESLYDLSLLNCRPSVVGAAILYAERRLRGAVPFWPSMLAKLTGYEDMATPELTIAVRVAQKLSRKVVYSQMYRAQLMCLSVPMPQGDVPSLKTGTRVEGGKPTGEDEEASVDHIVRAMQLLSSGSAPVSLSTALLAQASGNFAHQQQLPSQMLGGHLDWSGATSIVDELQG